MSAPSPAPSFVVPPGSWPSLHAFGEEVIVHLGGAETGGQFTMFTNISPPGGGPPPHYHAGEDEWFYPLEGRVEFFRNGEWNEVPLGTVVYIPRGEVHAFRNPGDQPLKILIHTAPSGFETYFSRCHEEFARPEGPDMARVLEISAEHGIHFVGMDGTGMEAEG